MKLKHQTKMRLYCAILGAFSGFLAAPKIVDVAIIGVRFGQKVCDKIIKRAM